MLNEILINIFVGAITLVIGWISGRYRNKKLMEKLEQQNNEQKEMLEKFYKLLGSVKKQTEPTGMERYVKYLVDYGIKEFGKKKIDELLYPDEY